MRLLDLFSGVGGFSLGLERAGMHTVAFCERDEYCRAVLRKHWPNVPCFDDIHTLDAERLGGLGRIDIVSGGFPCQPFSVAGKQRAQADDRHLWPQMRRVIALARPAWVIGENVTGLIQLALDDVLFDLEGLGYATRTFVIPACAAGAWHRRDRVWIVAADTRGEQHKSDSVENKRQAAEEFPSDTHSRSESVGSVHDEASELQGAMADANIKGLEGWQRGSLQERGGEWTARTSSPYADQYTAHDSAIGARAGRSESTWDWRIEPDVGRVAHGVPRRVDRLRALGNAVVPQVVEEIGRSIMRTGL